MENSNNSAGGCVIQKASYYNGLQFKTVQRNGYDDAKTVNVNVHDH